MHSLMEVKLLWFLSGNRGMGGFLEQVRLTGPLSWQSPKLGEIIINCK